ncbi:MAG: DNA primase [Thermoprotei archaeon]|nr:MAG: DNA primase [Thermoprotei archaeon]
MLRITYIDYRKYPFLEKVDRVLTRVWPGLNLIDLISSRSGTIYENAMKTFKYILETGKAPPPQSTSENEVITFYSTILLALLTNNKWAIERVAIAYSKRASEFLAKDSPESIIEVAHRLGIEVKYVTDNSPRIPIGIRRSSIIYHTLPYAIALKDYVKFSRRLSSDPKYALVNQILDRGWVYVDKKVLSRILEEAIKNYIKSMIKPVKEIPSELNELVEEIMNVLKEYIKGEQSFKLMNINGEKMIEGEIKGIIDYELFPPCMKKLVNELRSGENLSHHARFTVAAFLSRIGMDVNDILDLFKNSPDFNERIARYQVEHIAGLRGSRKQYMPYSCQTMKSLGLCPVPDNDCGVKNPLVIYYRNLRRKYKGNIPDNKSNK